ncbi:MAG: hypothetical protein E7Z80_03500 [Methanobrevibacter thaueri]|nr:hypothetical protein [Methanobrevibacter thaueri]
MRKIYELNIVPSLLKRFKVNKLIICGSLEKVLLNQIYKYCNENECSYNIINFEKLDENTIADYSLNALPNFKDYGAIFLNDDPNWFTVFNELNIIKNHNEEFPLVFICHDKFPYRFRDAYFDPKFIPDEYKWEYSKQFPILIDGNELIIEDGFFHATVDNTPRNGVHIAVTDFLNENCDVDIMDFILINEIVILYPKNSISQIRLSMLDDEFKDNEVSYDSFSKKFTQVELLLNYIDNLKSDLTNIDDFKVKLFEKDKLIDDFENKNKVQDAQMNYINTQMDSIESELSLKNSKIKHIQSKLMNKELEIDKLNNELFDANNQVNSLKNDLKEQQDITKQYEYEINTQRSELYNDRYSEKNIESLKNELNNKDMMLNSIKNQYNTQLFKLDNKEYCISCYKSEIENKTLEINFLKENSLIKKIFSPFAYFYLIFKSNPKELYLNYKLYKLLQNSKCFDIGYYLNNNKDLQNSLWCKYFSPELHYVCKGFEENRKFNKKYYNRNSKMELLEYILKCQE